MKTEINDYEMALIDLLACPHCKTSLIVEIFLEDELGINDGKLKCKHCQNEYLIKDGVFYFASNEYEFSKERSAKNWWVSDIEDYHRRLGEWHNLSDWHEKFGIPKEVAEFKYSRIQKRILNFMEPKDGNVIVDVGCGIGYFLFDVVERYSDKDILTVGIDISTHNILGLNKRRREQKKKNIFGIVGNASELPFKDGFIDKVICIEAIEHFPEPQTVIEEIHRVLKPYGKLFLSTPSKTAHNIWKKPFSIIKKPIVKFRDKKMSIKNAGLEYYDKPLYPKELKKLLDNQSFRIIKFVRTVILPPSTIFAFSPLKVTKILLNFFSFLENQLMVLFLPLSNNCVIECEKK